MNYTLVEGAGGVGWSACPALGFSPLPGKSSQDSTAAVQIPFVILSCMLYAFHPDF